MKSWETHNIPKVIADFADTLGNLEPIATGGGCDFVLRMAGPFDLVLTDPEPGETPDTLESAAMVAIYKGSDWQECVGCVPFPNAKEAMQFMSRWQCEPRDRFELVVGAADNERMGADALVYDHARREVILKISPAYKNLICLEKIPRTPFTDLVKWMNSLSKEDLESEGIPT